MAILINAYSPRLRIRHALLAALAIAIAGCVDTRENSVIIPQEAIERFGNKSAKEIMPLAGPKSFIAAFDHYSARNTTNPAKIKALLKRAGYIPLAHMYNEMTVFAHVDSKPLVALGRRDGSPDLCMVMSRKNKSLKPAVNAYLKSKFGSRLVEISDIAPQTDQAWIVDGPDPIIYVAISENDPEVGPLYAFAVGQDN